MMDPALVKSAVDNISGVIAAIAGLGTAAFGLVDATKIFGGGVSRAGLKPVRTAITQLLGTTGTAGIYGTADVLKTLEANWINGVVKADQKATAKSLVRLSLSSGSAATLAGAVGLEAGDLGAIADKIRSGTTLTAPELSILGRFDAMVSAILDEAYERGDQRYRNSAKVCAAVVAMALAIAGAWIIADGKAVDFFTAQNVGLALLIGAIATPLAPIAKDLSSSIAAAVSAVSSWKRT